MKKPGFIASTFSIPAVRRVLDRSDPYSSASQFSIDASVERLNDRLTKLGSWKAFFRSFSLGGVAVGFATAGAVRIECARWNGRYNVRFSGSFEESEASTTLVGNFTWTPETRQGITLSLIFPMLFVAAGLFALPLAVKTPLVLVFPLAGIAFFMLFLTMAKLMWNVRDIRFISDFIEDAMNPWSVEESDD